MLCGCDFCSPVLPQCLEQKLRFLKVPFIGRNLLDFKGRPSSNAPLFPGWRNSQKNFRAPGTRNQTQDLCNASKILSTLQELAARKVTWLSSSSFTQSVPLPWLPTTYEKPITPRKESELVWVTINITVRALIWWEIFCTRIFNKACVNQNCVTRYRKWWRMISARNQKQGKIPEISPFLV